MLPILHDFKLYEMLSRHVAQVVLVVDAQPSSAEMWASQQGIFYPLLLEADIH